MPLDRYPFSERYGWVEDRYGLSWQLILTNPEGEERPLVIPSLMFVGDVYGKAEEASDFYLSIFGDSKRGAIARYGKTDAPDKEGAVMFTDFKLEGRWFAAMESAHEQCGWLKDKYGVSWQIVPAALDELMASGDEEKPARVTQAFLSMKKFDIAQLMAAAEGA